MYSIISVNLLKKKKVFIKNKCKNQRKYIVLINFDLNKLENGSKSIKYLNYRAHFKKLL